MLDEFAAKQVARRAVIQLYVVERVGNDLRRPDQPGLNIPDLEEMHRSEQQTADTEREPQITNVPHEPTQCSMWLDSVQKRRIDKQEQWRQRPDRQEDDLAAQVVADFDLLLVFVCRVIDEVIAFSPLSPNSNYFLRQIPSDHSRNDGGMRDALGCCGGSATCLGQVVAIRPCNALDYPDVQQPAQLP